MRMQDLTPEQRADMKAALLECIDAVRSNPEIAEHCKVHRQSVYQWIKQGYVSGPYVHPLIEVAARHRLTMQAWRLRPDLHVEPVAEKGSRK